MKTQLEKFDEKLFLGAKKVAVALSGGGDSVALFYSLMDIKERLGFELFAINIDHSIRKEASEKDSEFVKNICEKEGVPLFFEKVDAKKYAKERAVSVEMAGRELRYSFFQKVKMENDIDLIALGHHLNDRAETLFLNLIKGSGGKGVTSMKARRGFFVRPMLRVSRDEIEEFLRDNEILFVTDESNDCTIYERNFIRKDVLGKIISRFPSALTGISSFIDLAERDEEYLSRKARELLKEDARSLYILVEDFSEYAISSRAVLHAMERCGVNKDVYRANVESVFELAKLQSGRELCLPKGVVALREYDKIRFIPMTDSEALSEIPFSIGEFDFWGSKLQISFEAKHRKSANPCYFDFDKIPQDAIIRSRRVGDVFFRSGGSVSLKEYFIDKKVPKIMRDKIPLLASKGRVLAVIGMETSKEIFVSEDTKKIASIKID